MACIKPVVSSHFIMGFGDMLDQERDKIQCRDGFSDKNIVLMTVVMESDILTIIRINALECDNGSAQVAADVLDDRFRIAEIWFGIDIETILIFLVNESLCLFERGAEVFFHFVQESGLEGFTQKCVVEMLYHAPETIVRKAALRNKAVDMRIPFQRSAKSMENADKTGNKVSGHVHFMEHTQDNTSDGNEKAVEKGTVLQEEVTELLIDGKDAVAMGALDEFEGHGIGTVLAVFDAAGRAETAFAAEGNKFHVSAFRTGVHCAAKRGITAMDHLVNVGDDTLAWMQDI